MHTWLYHACRNPRCALQYVEVPGSHPGICPRCGWLRTLAKIITRARG